MIVLEAWVEKIFSSFPLATSAFLNKRNDPFDNPVGEMTRQAGSAIYDAIAGEDTRPEDISKALERFIKLRAVQPLSVSEALAPVYAFKPILRMYLLERFILLGELEAYLAAESRLDTAALLAVDIYSQAKEALATARIKEIRARYVQLERWLQKSADAHGYAAGPDLPAKQYK